MIRPEVARLRDLAPLPKEVECSDEQIVLLEDAIAGLSLPLSQDEADALIDVLDVPDDSTYFGLMMSVRHAIESAPNFSTLIWTREGPWVRQMRELAQASGCEQPV